MVVRYFLDTEFNGFRGAPISLALVRDDGEELYLRLALDAAPDPWVERHVLPYLDHVPDSLRSDPMTGADAAAAIAYFLAGDPEPVVCADWPEDIAQMSMLLLTGPGTMVDVAPLTFRLVSLPGFSTAANSAVPHNALHDARALRDHVVGLE